MSLERTGARRFPVVVAALLGTVGVLLVGWLASSLLEPGRQDQTDRSTPVVLEAMADLSAYKAATGSFQVVVDREKDVNMVPSFLAGERTLMVATGQVDAEVDFSSLGPDAVKVSEDRTSVEIVLPHAQLSPAQLDNSRTYVAERQRGLVDRIGEALSSSPGDDQELLQQAEEELQRAAAGTELRQRAEDNTTSMLTSLLGSLGFEQVTVRFRDAVEQ
jgi:hypothetical protein